jgi:hypothetical protein
LPIIARKVDTNSDFEPVVELLQGGVIADVVDKGMFPNKFKPGTEQHKIYFVWIVEEVDSTGRNKRVFESFTNSLHEKASLRKRLKSLGYTDAQLDSDFIVDQVIGAKRFLVLTAEDGDDPAKPFIKVTAVMALKKGQTAPDIPADFERKEAKPAKPAPAAKPKAKEKPAPRAEEGITDDDIPF